jgi:hypothetical protein
MYPESKPTHSSPFLRIISRVDFLASSMSLPTADEQTIKKITAIKIDIFNNPLIFLFFVMGLACLKNLDQTGFKPDSSSIEIKN